MNFLFKITLGSFIKLLAFHTQRFHTKFTTKTEQWHVFIFPHNITSLTSILWKLFYENVLFSPTLADACIPEFIAWLSLERNIWMGTIASCLFLDI